MGSKIPLLVVLAVAAVFHSQMGDMEFGSLSSPGPGFWPRVLLVSIVLLSLVGLVADMSEGIESFDTSGTTRVTAGFVAMAAFVLMFETTGVIFSGVVFLMLWLKGLNGESWKLSIALSIIVPVVAYLLFVTALGVRFPADPIASLWGGR